MTLVDILKTYWIDAELKQVEFLQETKALSILFETSERLVDPTEAERQIIELQPLVESVIFYPCEPGELMMRLKYFFRNQPADYESLVQAQRVDNTFILGPHQDAEPLLKQWNELQQFLAVNGFDGVVTIEVLSWQEIEEEIARERQQHVKNAIVSNGNGRAKAAEEVKVNRYAHKPEMVRISDILSSDGYQRVVIEGQLVTMESRRLNSGRHILDTSFYDGTGTIGVKNMYSADEFEKMNEFLKLNEYYSVTGTVQYDNFSKELLIRANRFKQAKPVPKRQDRAPVKRIELGLQTTMSEIDGIVEVDAYLKQVHAWGHPAMAITDLNSVQAFPKAYELSKQLGIKVLYGLTLRVYDDTPEL
ncbi:MAG TPA: PHP domain-containing protein, partial [Tissierellia bacterium]|nr:PHP domain-containing protein [Tissierellia bacterium]